MPPPNLNQLINNFLQADAAAGNGSTSKYLQCLYSNAHQSTLRVWKGIDTILKFNECYANLSLMGTYNASNNGSKYTAQIKSAYFQGCSKIGPASFYSLPSIIIIANDLSAS